MAAPRKDELIYLASPYSAQSGHTSGRRYFHALRVCSLLFDGGYHVYSPIVHNHELAVRYDMRTDYEFWSAYNRTMIKRCDVFAVLLIPGWAESTGVRCELRIACDLGMTIYPIEYNQQRVQFKLQRSSQSSYC